MDQIQGQRGREGRHRPDRGTRQTDRPEGSLRRDTQKKREDMKGDKEMWKGLEMFDYTHFGRKHITRSLRD